MARRKWLALLAAMVIGSVPARAATGLVELTAVAPGVRLAMRYATADNFLSRPVYAAARCLLRPAVAERLARVQKRLVAEGYGLLLWDCYRPLSVQKQMWALVPDERYVADPAKGSRHNRGAAVDLGLVDGRGQLLEMPTAHDDFTPKASRSERERWTAAARRHYDILDGAMRAEGFTGLPSEWWHYDAPDWQGYGLLDEPLGQAQSQPSGT